MADIIESLTDGVTFKAPAHMSGPNVYRFKQKIMEALKEKPRAIVLDFDGVDFIDLHGLVIFRDLCELIRISGAQAFAYRLNREMRELFADFELLANLGSIRPISEALKTA
ncbi:MAG: STAS domain-containing protein [Candidatus Glassbacteria bacterium]